MYTYLYGQTDGHAFFCIVQLDQLMSLFPIIIVKALMDHPQSLLQDEGKMRSVESGGHNQ